MKDTVSDKLVRQTKQRCLPVFRRFTRFYELAPELNARRGRDCGIECTVGIRLVVGLRWRKAQVSGRG